MRIVIVNLRGAGSSYWRLIVCRGCWVPYFWKQSKEGLGKLCVWDRSDFSVQMRFTPVFGWPLWENLLPRNHGGYLKSTVARNFHRQEVIVAIVTAFSDAILWSIDPRVDLRSRHKKKIDVTCSRQDATSWSVNTRNSSKHDATPDLMNFILKNHMCKEGTMRYHLFDLQHGPARPTNNFLLRW